MKRMIKTYEREAAEQKCCYVTQGPMSILDYRQASPPHRTGWLATQQVLLILSADVFRFSECSLLKKAKNSPLPHDRKTIDFQPSLENKCVICETDTH